LLYSFDLILNQSFERKANPIMLQLELVQDLPFPLNLSSIETFWLTVSLFLIICFGLVLRGIVLAYLCEPEIHIGPINSLLWIDQLNGLVQVGVILAIIIGINVQNPLKDIFGDNFCYWINAPGNP
jgi:hypothetical protein